MDAALHERRKMNEEIEGTYLLIVDIIGDIETFDKTQRGLTAIGLYEEFYKQFRRLLALTRNPLKLKKADEVVTLATGWLSSAPVADRDDRVLLQSCKDGVKIFEKYQDALWEKGVLSLPNR